MLNCSHSRAQTQPNYLTMHFQDMTTLLHYFFKPMREDCGTGRWLRISVSSQHKRGGSKIWLTYREETENNTGREVQGLKRRQSSHSITASFDDWSGQHVKRTWREKVANCRCFTEVWFYQRLWNEHDVKKSLTVGVLLRCGSTRGCETSMTWKSR